MSDENSRRIAFIADDWGLSQPIHDAVTKLGELEAIDGAGIMMGQAYTELAVAWAKQQTKVLPGLHLFANDPDCQPMTRSAWPPFWPVKLQLPFAVALPPVRSIVLAEVRAQMEAYRATGLPLGFINSHFQFHARPAVIQPICDWLKELFPDFKGWMRLGKACLFPKGKSAALIKASEPVTDWIGGLLTGGQQAWTGQRNDTLWGVDRPFSNDAGEIADTVKTLGPGFHEFFFHPGRHYRLDQPDLGKDLEALTRLAALVPKASRRF